MPLVIVTGHPCAGKTRYATELQAYLQGTLGSGSSVSLINEESLGTHKATGYASPSAEKVCRAALKSAVDHALSASAWVIVDSMNYIKGFRYELHCLARTVKSTHCTVWITCEEADSDAWSAARDEAAPVPKDNYQWDTLVDLRRRFEPPNERNRWDRPLFRVCTSVTSSAVALEKAGVEAAAAAAAAAAATAEAEVHTSSFRRKGRNASSGASVSSSSSTFTRRAAKPASSVPEALVFNRLDAVVEEEAAATATGEADQEGDHAQAEEPQPESERSEFERIFLSLSSAVTAAPNSSTIAIPHGGADLLYELDRVSQEVTQAISAHLLNPEGRDAPLLLPQYDRSLQLHRTVGPAELQRHRLQFVRLNSKHPPRDPTAVGSTFVDFLAVHL